MADVFTETTHESWMGRIGNSIKGVVFGLLLFIVSFPLLFWNEGRAVTTARSLAEGEKNTVSVASDTIDPANEGKLVHTSGIAQTEETLRDEMFSVEANAIRVKRIVTMYQWEEDKHTESKKKLGGRKETVTTYRYDKDWSSSLIKSRNFKHPEGHQNPTSMLIKGHVKTASRVTLGAFHLPTKLVQSISGGETIALTESNIPDRFGDQMQVSGEELYLGNDSAAPQVGDLRVRFELTPAQDVSIISQQSQDSFRPHQTDAGDALSRLEIGTLSAAEMFAHARSENSMFTWLLRAIGTGLMMLGLAMLMAPLAVLGDVVPIVGSIVQGGTFIVAGLITLVLAPMTMAIAWMFYRPLVAIPLVAVSVTALFFLVSRRKSGKLPEVMTMDETDLVG